MVTTISPAKAFLEYAKNLLAHAHASASFIIIGDVKTPVDANRKIVRHLRDLGFEAEFRSLEDQAAFMKQFPEMRGRIPENPDYRRNVGYLLAAANGNEVIVSVDDDNFPRADDYIAGHSHVGTTGEFETVYSPNGWFNPCALLEMEPTILVYMRGFPASKRGNPQYRYCRESGHVVINMGLWYGHPDVDAATNITLDVKSVGFTRKRVMIGKGNYAPINTQNTAFVRELMPVYYYVLMRGNGHPADRSKFQLDRYGDIWSGILTMRALNAMDERATIGAPYVNHDRNPHNYLRDLEQEVMGMVYTDALSRALPEWDVDGKDYFDVYARLARGMAKFGANEPPAIRKHFERISDTMDAWLDTCGRIM